MKEICEYLFSQSNSEINHRDPLFETWIKPIESENTNINNETKENDVENYNKENEINNDEKEDN